MEVDIVASKNLHERFHEKYIVDNESGCREWVGTKTVAGYGRFWLCGEFVYAHRVAYELANGVIPDGKVIDHLCRNSSCVNPAHLEAVTQGVNVRRGNAAGKNGHLGVRCREKTHCPQGHPYDGDNLFVTKEGFRQCKACRLARTKAWQASERGHEYHREYARKLNAAKKEK